MRRIVSVLVTACAAMLVSGATLGQAPEAAPPAKAADAKKPGKAADAAKAEANGVPGKGERPAGKADPAPGKSDEAHGKAGDSPGKSDEAHGKADQAPGRADKEADSHAGQAEVKEGAAAREEPKARDARKKSQRDAARAKVIIALKGQPMREAMKQELRRHAQRVARLERIKQLAMDNNDQASIERVSKLVAKEQERHDKWIANFDAKTETQVGAK
jgi:uncharacterized protein YjbJ (UPF0337 family)